MADVTIVGNFEPRIITIMGTLAIDFYVVKTWLDRGVLYDEMRVHFKGDAHDQTSTANEFEQPTFGLLKELELLVMGETS